MPEAVIVSAVRTPVGRAYKGSLRATRPDDLAALVIKEALGRGPRDSIPAKLTMSFSVARCPKASKA